MSLEDEKVIQAERLGNDYCFIELKPELGEFKRLAFTLNDCDATLSSVKAIKELVQQLANVGTAVQALQKYKPSQNTNEQLQLINNFRAVVEETFTAATPIIAMNAARTIDDRKASASAFQAEIKKFSEAIQEQLHVASESAKGAKFAADEAAAAATTAKKAATKTGVSEEARHFQTLSDNHKMIAKVWLSLSAVTAIIILTLAWYHFYHPYNVTPAEKWIVLQHIISKLIVISILSFLLIFSVRNYNTSRHNHVINEHRAKALATFQTFVGGTASDETKDAVLIQSCKAVFGHHASGYLRKESESSGSPMIDLLKPFVK